ncbi:MAG: hypothetical protein HY699_22480 [Deltaproteobacteria bacterium]|nr:hypothetical protein [Deltaproteobacteria bacterium]
MREKRRHSTPPHCATGTVQLTADTWYRIETRADVAGAQWSATATTLYSNGGAALETLSCASTMTASCNHVALMASGQAVLIADDLDIHDGTSPGNVRVVTLAPTGATANDQWTKSGCTASDRH